MDVDDSMLLILMFLLATYGSTNIIVSSKLLEEPRKWLSSKQGSAWQAFASFMKCPMCVGFWMGFFWYMCGLYPDMEYDFEWLSAGVMGSGFTWIVRVILAKLGEDNL